MKYNIDDKVLYVIKIAKPQETVIEIPAIISSVKRDCYNIEFETDKGATFNFFSVDEKHLKQL